MRTIDDVLSRVQELDLGFDTTRINFAYQYAKVAHEGQKRFSGEEYITHPLEVSYRVLDFYPDEDMVVAALLHDVSEDTDYTLDDIEGKFGPAVRNLVYGLEKLSKVRSSLNEPEIENLRKMFLSMAADIRVIIIKLCDRWHNMETLEHVRPEKQKRIALETMQIYAPISSRLGIFKLKGELEDLCFRYLNPQMYDLIKNQLDEYLKRSKTFIAEEKEVLQKFLKDQGYECEVLARVKNMYSIFKKLKKKGRSTIADLYDIIAFRIILNDSDISKLYQLLGVIHNRFVPIPERFKDYVAMPKPNGYQSLHTSVVGLGPKGFEKPVEIQIRNKQMHIEAEFGVACHWRYKESKNSESPDRSFSYKTNWIKSLIDTEHDLKNNKEFLEYLHIDALNDRIFILTPDGHVKDLPKGATPVDFAYTVHTDLGNMCYMSKVNGSVVPLDYELKNGQVVEILTRKNSHPNRYWLSFVVTSSARQKIKAYLRSMDKAKNIKLGREILNKELQRFGKPVLGSDLKVLKTITDNYLQNYDADTILEELGYGRLSVGQVMKELYPMSVIAKQAREPLLLDKKDVINLVLDFKVSGFSGMPFRLANCCKDLKKGDPIMGYVASGKAISVHKKACKVLIDLNNDFKIPIFWSNVEKRPNYYVNICIELEDRHGFLCDVTRVISEEEVNINDISLQKSTEVIKEGYKMRLLELEVQCFEQLDRIMRKIGKIEGVIKVSVVT